MRISDWSSDVCSSDLASGYLHEAFRYAVDRDPHRHALGKAHPAERRLHIGEQRARSGGPFTVADGRRHPDDMTFEHAVLAHQPDRRMLALRSEEHTSELQPLMRISYAVFCLKN